MHKLFSQPVDGSFADQFIGALSRGGFAYFKHVTVLVAYARLSGVLRLKAALGKFLNKGGKADFVIGVGQGNTSGEALEALRNIGVNVYVYHDKNPAHTFHPKVYLLSRPGELMWASIGSSNLTAGGLFSNYEANAIYELDLTIQDQEKAADAFTQLVSPYIDVTGPCAKRLKGSLLQKLKEYGYLISEAKARANFKKIGLAKKGKPPLFGSLARVNLPPAAIEDVPSVAAQAATLSLEAGGFYKRLSRNDASKKSSPGQIQIPIQFLKQFPPLSDPEVTKSGAAQSDAYFHVMYVEEGSTPKIVKNVRAILYEPAPTHKRPNKELRFTFRSQEILQNLQRNDVLVFRRTDDENIWFQVKLIKNENADEFTKRFGLVTFGI